MNISFYENENNLQIGSLQAYQDHCTAQAGITKYYLFKNTKTLLGLLGNHYLKSNSPKDIIVQPTPLKEPKVEESVAFLNVIAAHLNYFPKTTQIIVFSVNGRSSTGDFVVDVKNQLEQDSNSTLAPRMHFIDFSAALTPDKYFLLDDHINSQGHKTISEELVTKLRLLDKN